MYITTLKIYIYIYIQQYECKNQKFINKCFLQKIQARRCGKYKLCYNVFSFLTQNLNPTGLDRKCKTSLEQDYVKMIWDTCVLDKFTKFIYLQDNFIELSQPHITYQKANNIVVRCADY